MKKTVLIFSFLLLILGVVLFVDDMKFHKRHGFYSNEVAGEVDGELIDWPTGEIPLTAMFSDWIYGIGFAVAGVGLFFWSVKNRVCLATNKTLD